MLYVNPSIGDDTASGSQSDPFRTISHALHQAAVGSIIQLAPGMYSADSGEQFPLEIPASVVLIGDEASRGQGYIICGSGAKSTLDGTQEITIWLEQNAELRGVTVTNPAVRGTGVWLQRGISVLANCTLKGCQREGIRIMGQAQPKVINNLCIGNDAYGIWVLGQAGGEMRQNVCHDTGTGFAISDRASPILIDNLIRQNSTGMLLSQNVRPVLRRNRIERNTGDGLVVMDDALPDLGTGDDFGKNILRKNGGYDLQNDTPQRLLSVGNQVLLSKIKGLIELMHNQQPDPISDLETNLTEINSAMDSENTNNTNIDINAQNVDTRIEDIDTHINVSSHDLGTQDSDIKNVDTQDLGTQDSDAQDSDIQDVYTHDLGTQDSDIQDVNNQNVDTDSDVYDLDAQDADTQNVNAQDLSAQDAVIQDGYTHDLGTQDSNTQNVNAQISDTDETADSINTAIDPAVDSDPIDTDIADIDDAPVADSATNSATNADNIPVDSTANFGAIATNINDAITDTDDAVDHEFSNLATNRIANAVERTNPPSQADVLTANLSDIQGHWAAPFIQALVERDIITNFADGTFRPDTHMTRSQFAAWIVQAFDQPFVRQEIQFRDLPPNFWAADAIAKATRMGFLSGYSGRRFQPNQEISRVQAIVALVSGLGLADGSRNLLRIYHDRLRIPAYAKAKVAAATQSHLVVNYPEVKALRPMAAITRAEGAALMHQALVEQGRLPAIASAYIVQPQKMGLIFTDIQAHEAVEAIQAIAARGWVSGYSDGTFRPDARLTRAQYATLIAKVFDPPANHPLISFTDVSDRFWAKAAIAQAHSGGYLSGYPNGTFKPNAYATRLNVVTSLVTGLDLPAADPAIANGFADHDEIPAVAKSAIASAIQTKIIAPPGSGDKFEPFRHVTRAEAVKMVHQALIELGRM